MIYNRPFQNKSRRLTFLSGVVTGLAAAALSILLYTFIVRIDACLKTQFPTIEDTLLHNKFEQNILYGPYRETVETLSLSPTEEAVFWADKMHIVFTTLQRQWNGRWKVMEYQVTNFRMDSQYAYGQDPRRPYSPYDSSMTAYTKLLRIKSTDASTERNGTRFCGEISETEKRRASSAAILILRFLSIRSTAFGTVRTPCRRINGKPGVLYWLRSGRKRSVYLSR